MQPIQPSTPQMYEPPTGLTRRINWLVVLGATVTFVGSILGGIANFSLATVSSTANFDSIRWVYQVAGAGSVVFGVGLMMALVGLAMGRHA